MSLRLDDARSKRFVQHVLFGYHRYRDRFMDYNTETYNVAAILRTVPGPVIPVHVPGRVGESQQPNRPAGNLLRGQPANALPFARPHADRSNQS